MIEVEQLTKRFGTTIAVDAVSFQVREGETLVLLGTSGCGKTTTLRMLNRLVEPDSGSIVINGQPVAGKSGMPTPEILRRSIGYVIQQTGLFPHYSVAENIAVVPRLLHWSDEQIHQRTHELLTMLRLPEAILSQYPSQLSGGQQQRVGLARALAVDPPILLMDEPFGALDPITRNSIRQEFKTLEALRRKTIVLITHDVSEAFELGNRIGLMHQGKFEQIGTPAELLFQPANEFVRDFLSDQRLVLEMKTLKIKDLISEIPAETGMETGREASVEASMWEVLQNSITQTAQTGYLKIRRGDNWQVLSVAKLWEKFLQK